MSRNNPLDAMTTASTTVNSSSSSSTATVMIGATGTTRCGILETRVRGAWYRVTVTLESEYLSVSLDETCEPVDQTTTLNGTLGWVEQLIFKYSTRIIKFIILPLV